MRRTKHVIATILFCTGLLVSGFQKNDAVVCAAKINTNTTSNFNENKLKTGALEMQEVILDASGKIVSYYIDEDGINQKVVYDEKKDKWTSNTVKDTAKNIKGKKKYYTIYPTAKGYVEAAPDSSEIIFRNEKGKKIKTHFFAKIKEWKKSYSVKQVLEAGKNRYVLICQIGKQNGYQAVCVDFKSNKIQWTKKVSSTDAEIIGDKLYSYTYCMDEIVNPIKKSDVVKTYRIKDGKHSDVIDATPIRNLVKQLKGQKTEDAYPITDQEIVFAGHNGKLYAAYMSGIYVYQSNKKSWKCLVNGVDNDKYSLSRDMTAIDLLVSSEKEFYVLASKGNYDGEATDFLKYKIG